jgi:hypothetical protein
MTKSQQPDRGFDDRFASLERRVAALEARLGGEPPRPPAPHPDERWRVIANWRGGIRRGGSEADVRRAIGEPRTIHGGYITIWYYDTSVAGAHVTFSDGKVSGWQEPR